MSPDTAQKLTRLLITFDAQRLGEGDTSAGANVLAAMACAIADIHRHGTRMSSGDGPSYHIGSSVLAHGPLTSALVSERVTSVLAEYQANLDDHCNEWELAKEVHPGTLSGKPDKRFKVSPSTKSFQVLNGEMLGEVSDNIAVLLTPLPTRMKRALFERPLLFATGAQPRQLGAALERSHAGQLLVHDVMRAPAQCAELADCCLPLIDGCLTVGKQARPVRGHVLLCDPSLVLDEVLRDGSDARRLLVRLPWLVDGNAGPSLPVAEASAANETGIAACRPRLDRMDERFRAALTKAWIGRLDYTAEEPETLDFDFAEYQARWVAFLQQKETDFPGISATARPLFATLLFGLLEILNSLPTEKDVQLYAEDVEALALILVQRMCNARAVILHDAAKEARERKLQVMFDKLSARPGNPRDLARKHHRLPVSEARDLLDELVTRGRAIDCGNDRYEAVHVVCQHQSPVLTLEA
jgi:hypothetical protein